MTQLLFILLIFSSCPVFSQLISRKESAEIDELVKALSETHQPQNYLVQNVNIISMSDSVTLAGQDVLIEKGKIVKTGLSLNAPADTRVIDGSEKYLIPGLTDMHVHLFSDHPMKNTWLLLLVLNGVTSVRDMAGQPEKLALREKTANNEVFGPVIYQAGPIINGLNNQYGVVLATTPEQGRALVNQHHQSGYDLIKVYDNLDRKTFLAISEEAAKRSMPVAGHVPDAISLSEALMHQSSIEHLTAYLDWNGSEAHLAAVDDYARKTGESLTWNCPTFYNLMMNWGTIEDAEAAINDPDIVTYLPGNLRKRWGNMINKNTKAKSETVSLYGKANRALFSEVVLNLYRENARLIAGTDAGNLPLLVPGFALHQEFENLSNLGIAPYDILQMATINAAMALNKEKEFGSVEPGKRADLVLLSENPLKNLSVLRHPDGVMLHGIWLSKEVLENISSDIKTIFGND